MGRGESLTEEERQVLIYNLSQGKNAVQIGKLLKRDTRTIKKAISNIDYARAPRRDKGKCMVPQESIDMIRDVAQKNPGLSSNEIFEIAGVGGCGKSLRCSILKKVGLKRTAYISRGPPITVDNITTEALSNIKLIAETNPDLSSKDIFELAGVPDVSKVLREQILKEFSVTVTNIVKNADNRINTTNDSDVTDKSRDTGTSANGSGTQNSFKAWHSNDTRTEISIVNRESEHISDESLSEIEAIMKTNPHLSSKDIFDIAGVPIVNETLREQIIKKISVGMKDVVTDAGVRTNIKNDSDTTNISRETGTSATCRTTENLSRDRGASTTYSTIKNTSRENVASATKSISKNNCRTNVDGANGLWQSTDNITSDALESRDSENISAESLSYIKAIMLTNPHLSSKDIFELAGVYNTSQPLRDKILKELTVPAQNVAYNAGVRTNTFYNSGVTNIPGNTFATVPYNTNENCYRTNVAGTSGIWNWHSNDTRTNASIENRDSNVVIIKEEIPLDTRREEMDPISYW